MCFLPLKSSHYPSRPVPVPELFGKYPTRPVPKSKTPTRQTLFMRGRLQCYIWGCMDGWDRYSKSTFYADNYRRTSQDDNQQMDAGQNKQIWESGLKPTTDHGCHTKFLAKNSVREAIPKNMNEPEQSEFHKQRELRASVCF